jgi:hypothetical protein
LLRRHEFVDDRSFGHVVEVVDDLAALVAEEPIVFVANRSIHDGCLSRRCRRAAYFAANVRTGEGEPSPAAIRIW